MQVRIAIVLADLVANQPIMAYVDDLLTGNSESIITEHIGEKNVPLEIYQCSACLSVHVD